MRSSGQVGEVEWMRLKGQEKNKDGEVKVDQAKRSSH